GPGGGGMMVIPAIDLRGGRCVRLTEGDPSRQTTYGNDPVGAALRFEEEGAQWIHVVDLDAALGAGSNGDTIAAISAEVPIPLQVGGGLRTAEGIQAAIRMGAGRAVLGTTVEDPSFIRSQVERHGDRIVAAVDVRDGRAMLRGWLE